MKSILFPQNFASFWQLFVLLVFVCLFYFAYLFAFVSIFVFHGFEMFVFAVWMKERKNIIGQIGRWGGYVRN